MDVQVFETTTDMFPFICVIRVNPDPLQLCWLSHLSDIFVGMFAGITLAALLIPIAAGMVVKKKWPSQAKKILKVGWLRPHVGVACSRVKAQLHLR